MQEEFVEDLPRQQSYLQFFFSALGIRYSFLLPLAALVSFVLVLIVVLRGKGSWMSAALVLLVPLPFYVGILGVIDGMLASLQVIAMSDTSPKPSALAEGISMSLVTALVGLWLSVPGYLLAVVGSIVRSLGREEPPSHCVPMAAQVIESKP
jgi:hypothetical protein